MSMVSMPIPAGWYPDPAGSFQQRWWTGESWTNDFAQYRPTLVHSAPAAEVLLNQAAQPQMASSTDYLAQQAAATTNAAAQAGSDQGASYSSTQTLTRQQPAAVEPVTAFRLPDADQPPQTTVAQPNAGNATLIAVAPAFRSVTRDPALGGDYQPFGSMTDIRRGDYVHAERRYTAAVWLLAVMPLVLGGAAYVLASYLPVLYTTFSQALLLALFLIVSLVLAAIDRRALRLDAHDSTAAPALALLTPLVFMVVRTVLVTRETGRNTMGPLILLLVVIAGIVAALVVVDGLLPLLLTATALY